MSRVEKLKAMIAQMDNDARTRSITVEDMKTCLLADIAMSLAVIADALSKGGSDE